MAELRFTAVGGGYYTVYVNGVATGKHSDEREACESIANLKLASPSDAVEFRHDYTVKVSMITAPVTDTSITSSTGKVAVA